MVKETIETCQLNTMLGMGWILRQIQQSQQTTRKRTFSAMTTMQLSISGNVTSIQLLCNT